MDKKPDEQANVKCLEHIFIKDADTGEVILNKRFQTEENKDGER